MRFLKYLRHCSYCSIWPNFHSEILCQDCWQILEEKSAQNIFSLNYTFDTCRIWEWNSQENSLDSFLYFLKGGWAKEVFKKLAQKFMTKRNLYFINPKSVIIPAPAFRSGSHDHALAWAKALSEISGIPISNSLERTSSAKGQKNKTLKQRLHLKLNLLQKEKFNSVIFVDDIITTGSTAQAAYEALGKPRCFEVWVVAERLKER